MAKKGYASREEAAAAAARANEMLGSLPGAPEYVPYEYTDPLNGESKHLIRRKPQPRRKGKPRSG